MKIVLWIKIPYLGTVKWVDIKQQGDIEQSYLFHRNSLISEYNSHAARCLCYRLATEGFCSPHPKFFKYPHDLQLSFFAWNAIFKWKNLMFWDKTLIKCYFLPTGPGLWRNICLIYACHGLLLFWQEKFKKVLLK